MVQNLRATKYSFNVSYKKHYQTQPRTIKDACQLQFRSKLETFPELVSTVKNTSQFKFSFIKDTSPDSAM